ncbi:MAG: YigZ family protein [Christensenella sp.]|nr:YigZ family protein [Christensenella sp.]
MQEQITAPQPEYFSPAQRVSRELVIKKSRFICDLIPITTEQTAAQEIAAIKKKHYNARHHCFAMILGARRDFEKGSDDGEPQGTAGVPMLEVLRKSGLTNVLAVVTRYFGGTLLGAGGLVRAYSGAVAEAVKTAEVIRHVPAVALDFKIAYADYAKLQSIASEFGATVEAEYGEAVMAKMIIRHSSLAQVQKKISEAFLGADVYRIAEECMIAEPAGKTAEL